MKIDFTKWTEAGFRVFPLNGKHPHWPSLPLDSDNNPTWLPYTEREPSDDEITTWESTNGYTGVAVLTGKVSGIVALDWDCVLYDYPEIISLVPESPVIRVGKSPKWMRFYKYNPQLPSKKIKLKSTAEIKDGIELLTDGRYFVADGIHPDTKKPYFYVGEHLLNVSVDELPEFPLSTWQAIDRIAEKYRQPTDYVASGGRHDTLLTYTGRLIAAGVNEAEAIKSIQTLDDSFPESYFKTHRGTSPEKMYKSVLKTHRRNAKKKTLVEVLPADHPQHEVTVHVDDGQEPSIGSAAAAKLLALGVVLSQQGKPIKNEVNALKVVSNWNSELHPDFIWYDEFHRNYFTRGLDNQGKLEPWNSKTHLIELLMLIQDKLKFHGMTKDILKDAVLAYARKRSRNEVQDYIKSLEWDGTPRINKFLIDCFGAEDNQYTRYASKNLLIGLVARVFNQGCKLDTMVVLEGKQGKQKSTGLKTLVGDRWFAESYQDPENKDFYVCLQGKWLVEISELEAFNKADSTTIKRMLSCSTDRFRAPYGDIAMDWPRQNVFVGTTNDAGYLKDTTGNRRFWPISTGTVNVDEIDFFRDMFFAEAYTRFLKGESWWQMPELETLEQQEARVQEDSWQEAIEEYLLRNPVTTIKDIAVIALDIKLQDINRNTENRIAACLRRAGWDNKPFKDPFTKKTVRKWRRLQEV